MIEKLPFDVILQAIDEAASASVTAIHDYQPGEFASTASAAQLARLAAALAMLDQFQVLYLGAVLRQLPADRLQEVQAIINDNTAAFARRQEPSEHG